VSRKRDHSYGGAHNAIPPTISRLKGAPVVIYRAIPSAWQWDRPDGRGVGETRPYRNENTEAQCRS